MIVVELSLNVVDRSAVKTRISYEHSNPQQSTYRREERTA
jgi:hypothetical protein